MYFLNTFSCYTDWTNGGEDRLVYTDDITLFLSAYLFFFASDWGEGWVPIQRIIDDLAYKRTTRVLDMIKSALERMKEYGSEASETDQGEDDCFLLKEYEITNGIVHFTGRKNYCVRKTGHFVIINSEQFNKIVEAAKYWHIHTQKLFSFYLALHSAFTTNIINDKKRCATWRRVKTMILITGVNIKTFYSYLESLKMYGVVSYTEPSNKSIVIINGKAEEGEMEEFMNKIKLNYALANKQKQFYGV